MEELATRATGVVRHAAGELVVPIEDFVAMNERLLSRMQTLAWTIRGQWGDESAASIEWVMRGKPKLGPTVEVEGMSRVRALDGKVVDHRDYWDLSELSASAIPGGEDVRRLLLRPFA